MREIEKAIQVLKVMANFTADINLDAQMAYKFAIQALQEKTERENGCECCNHHVPVKNFAKEYSIEVDDLEVSLWEDLKCLATIKIDYCPMCGRKLTRN